MRIFSGKAKIGDLIIFLVGLSSLSILVYFRYRLSLIRYFDVDEFAHLHWGYSFLIGERPYSDFFYIFPPYFLYFVSFIISIAGRSAQTLINVRGAMFAVQILSYLVLFLWAKKSAGVLTALISILIFVFLPLPSDKLLEIRPDLLATVLALSGLYVFVLAEEKAKNILFFISGFLLSASLMVVPKTVFFLFPVFAVVIYRFFTLKKGYGRDFFNNYILMAIAAGINLAVCARILFLSGNFWQALYLITKLAGDVTKNLASKFYMRPDIFFYPNDTYYGMGGINPVLIANLFIYILGSIWGIRHFISSFSHSDNRKVLREFVFAAAFLVNLFAFVKIFPLKHLQYLITVAPFVSYYFADFLVSQTSGFKFKNAFYFIVIVYITVISGQMFQVKFKWVNTETFTKIREVLATIPEDKAVFDLTGETVFYRDGYYFCCLPYGQYEESLNFNYPDLETDLKRRGTQYVHAGTIERLGVLPVVHQKFIKENYAFSDGSETGKLTGLGVMVKK